jgi:hypothetical protein
MTYKNPSLHSPSESKFVQAAKKETKQMKENLNLLQEMRFFIRIILYYHNFAAVTICFCKFT